MVFTLRPFGHTAGSFVQRAMALLVQSSSSSYIARFVQGGVVKTFRYTTYRSMNPLATAFHRLGESPSQALAYWYMDNGAEFHMAVPRGDDVLADRFSDAIEFPFRYDNIVRIGLLSDFPQTTFTCDIDAMHHRLSGIPNLSVERESGAALAGQTNVDVLWLVPVV